jgi:acetyl-CoA acetyltransferase
LGRHPYGNVSIVAAHNTRQARELAGHDSLSITIDAAVGALEQSGLDFRDIDAVFGSLAPELVYELGLGPASISRAAGSIAAVVEAANAVAAGTSKCALIAEGAAGTYTDRTATAPWTRPANEFVVPFGLYTAVEFALGARRHMELYGTTAEQMAFVAKTVRNNGHVNPEAVYYGRGPYEVADILASRMVADPFHLLECAMTAEGGAAIIMTTADRARDLRQPGVFVLGAGTDRMGPAYRHPPAWDLSFNRSEPIPNGYIGRRAARAAFEMAGVARSEVDCFEFYDPFSFEIIRQFEAFEFCGAGEGGAFVMSEGIGPGGRVPITTDGGTMSFGHSGAAQMLQRVVRGVQQIQGTCLTAQVPDVNVVICSNGGAGAMFNDVILLGRESP